MAATSPAPLAAEQNPAANALPTGLLSAVLRPEPDSSRWEGGFAVVPDVHSGYDRNTQIDDATGVAIEAHTPPAVTAAELEYVPFEVNAGLVTRRLSMPQAEYEQRIRRTFALVESHIVEQNLSDHPIAGSYDLEGAAAAIPDEADPVTSGRIDVTARAARRALGIIDQLLGTHVGAQGLIHVPAAAGPHVTEWCRTNAAGQWLSPAGHIVVIGSGYSGQAPGGAAAAADQTWIYGTPQLVYRRSEIYITPTTVTEAAALARRTNWMEWRATATAALSPVVAAGPFGSLVDLTA